MAVINSTNFLLYKSQIDPIVSAFIARVGTDGGTIEAINCVRDAFEDQKQPLGHSTNVSISLNVDMPESTNKQSQGFKEVLPGVKSGNISVEGLVDYTDTLSYADYVNMLVTREKAEFYMQAIDDNLIFNGNGFITSVEEIAPVEGVTTYSIELELTNIIEIN
jgi:predicted secreted protein